MRKDLLNAKELIMQMIEQELPKYEIAKRLNCKQATLDSYLQKLNIENESVFEAVKVVLGKNSRKKIR